MTWGARRSVELLRNELLVVIAESLRRIALVTDFGPGIYRGQVHGVLSALVPGIPVVDLAHDLTPFRPELGAYLLPALVRDMPRGTLYLCVIDPGVGSERNGLAVAAGGDWFVGPDNGFLSRVMARAQCPGIYRIDWQPAVMSASFHGRDWFAGVAARLVSGQRKGLARVARESTVGWDWVDELAAVVYRDGYGNLMCGLRAGRYAGSGQLIATGRALPRARTFSDVAPGVAFWYENALGLVEIAVNRGRADLVLGLSPGDMIGVPVDAPV